MEELERLGEVAALQLQDEEEKTRMAEIEEDERLAKELSQQLQHEHQVSGGSSGVLDFMTSVHIHMVYTTCLKQLCMTLNITQVNNSM